MNKILALACLSSLPLSVVVAKTVDVIDTITVNPTVINNYAQVTINMTWSTKHPVVIEIGDTFSVGLPSQMRTFDTNTKMYNQLNEEVGDCSLVAQTFNCTFTQARVLDGTIGFTRSFFDNSVTTPNQIIPTTYTQNGQPKASIEMIVSPTKIDPTEILFKFGDPVTLPIVVDSELKWFVRINCRADEIDNLKL